MKEMQESVIMQTGQGYTYLIKKHKQKKMTYFIIKLSIILQTKLPVFHV